MIPKITHQTARTSHLNWEEGRLTRRMRKLLPDWDHQLWDNSEQAAAVRRIFPHLSDRFDAIPFGVARSDIARYALLYEYGGMYLDIDYKLLRAFDEDLRSARVLLPIELYEQNSHDRYREFVIGNSLLGSTPKQQFWYDLVEYIFAKHSPDLMTSEHEIVGKTGPVALTDFYLDAFAEKSEVTLAAKNLFQPDIWAFGMRNSADENTYGVHLHWGSWRGHDRLLAARILLRRKLNALAS